jgi:hypothetical protein
MDNNHTHMSLCAKFDDGFVQAKFLRHNKYLCGQEGEKGGGESLPSYPCLKEMLSREALTAVCVKSSAERDVRYEQVDGNLEAKASM